MFRMIRFVWDLFISHKVRFLLTISGIVVGVASLVTLASLLHTGKGVLAASSNKAVGDDLVNIRDSWRARKEYPNERRLDYDDLKDLDSSVLLDSTEFTALYDMQSVNIQLGVEVIDARMVGIGHNALSVHGLTVDTGRNFHKSDFEEANRVCLVGADLVEDLPGLAPGSSLNVNGEVFLVVGVMNSKPATGPGKDWSWNSRVLIPAKVYNLMFNPSRKPDTVVGKVSLPVAYAGTIGDFVSGVKDMSRIVLMNNRVYENFDLGESGQGGGNEEVIMFTIEALIIMTTIFSMIVGGINIMNIMLVTVTERTREIGIRRALGATKRDILKQFLAETLGITLLGAIVGTGIALATVAIASQLLTKYVYPWPFYLATWSLILALGFSTVIGLIFGISPAMRAANLDPVDALRFE